MHRYFGLGSVASALSPLWPDGPVGERYRPGWVPLAYRRFKTDFQRMESDEYETDCPWLHADSHLAYIAVRV